MDKNQAILKIKDLLSLASSSNENEAENARKFADKLKEKYSIKDFELQDEAPVENNKNLLFESKIMEPWKASLGSAVAQYFYCSLVQVISETKDSKLFQYFVYGEDADVEMVKSWFEDFLKRVSNLITLNKLGRGERYITSFSQGVADGVQEMLQELDVERPERKKSSISTSEGKELLSISNKEIKKPEKVIEKTEMQEQYSSQLIDGYAYLRGRQLGAMLPLPKTLNQNNE